MQRSFVVSDSKGKEFRNIFYLFIHFLTCYFYFFKKCFTLILQAFFTPLRIGSVNDCLIRMKVLSDEYKSCPQSTPDVSEAYIKDEKEWVQLHAQIEAFLAQLHKLKADWSEYCQRLENLFFIYITLV